MQFLRIFSLAACIGLAIGEFSLAEAQLARVAVPVADLRGEPSPASPRLEHDPLEESQLLYGEEVEVLEELDGWARVAAAEQREWTHNNQWEGYPGWMELGTLTPYRLDWTPNLIITSKSGKVRVAPDYRAPVTWTLSFGSRLFGIEQAVLKNGGPEAWWRLKLLDGRIGWIRSEEVTSMNLIMEWRSNPAAVRNSLVKMARLFLGDPYYWGGRSASQHERNDPPPHWGCDCSGLVGLIYRANGFQIPRDAHEIWMQARAISKEELSPGDLVFLSNHENPDRISHIMLYAGDGKVIEAPRTGLPVREITLEERLKESPDRQPRFGAYLPSSS